tara:strand:+ start:884 stop:1042 length:159 start_codon:yes stop_codon:yes gene_type:complete
MQMIESQQIFLMRFFGDQKGSSYRGISIPYQKLFLHFFVAIVNKNIMNMGGG